MCPVVTSVLTSGVVGKVWRSRLESSLPCRKKKPPAKPFQENTSLECTLGKICKISSVLGISYFLLLHLTVFNLSDHGYSAEGRGRTKKF